MRGRRARLRYGDSIPSRARTLAHVRASAAGAAVAHPWFRRRSSAAAGSRCPRRLSGCGVTHPVRGVRLFRSGAGDEIISRMTSTNPIAANCEALEPAAARPAQRGCLQLLRRRRGGRDDPARQPRRLRPLLPASARAGGRGRGRHHRSSSWASGCRCPSCSHPPPSSASPTPTAKRRRARAARAAGTLMVASTLSTTSIEDTAAAAPGPLWFQLYVFRQREITRALVERAEAAGCTAICLTVTVARAGKPRARHAHRLSPAPGAADGELHRAAAGRLPRRRGIGAGGVHRPRVRPHAHLGRRRVAALHHPASHRAQGDRHARGRALAVEHGADARDRLQPRRPPARLRRAHAAGPSRAWSKPSRGAFPC